MAPRPSPRPAPKSGPLDDRVVRITLLVVAGGVVIAMLRFFQLILSPLLVATFLLLLIDSLSRAVQRLAPRAPAWARNGIAVVVILAAFILVGGVMTVEAPAFAARIQSLGPRLNALLIEYGAPLGLHATSVDRLFSGVNVWNLVATAFKAARGVVSYGVLVVIYLAFLALSRATFERKIDLLYDTDAHRAAARRVTSSVRRAVQKYVQLQTVKSGITTTVAFTLLSLMGVEDAAFLAFAVFFIVFVPILGPAIGVLLPTVFTLAQFGDIPRAAVVAGIMEFTVFVNGNVIMPKLQSDQLNIDPLLVLLSLGFWGLVFGPPGVLLSTPLTVAVMALAAEFEKTRWVAVLLSKDGHPVRDAL